MTPEDIRVTYSATGAATSLTVAQAQTTPSTLTPTTVVTALSYVVVPFTGTASTSAGNPAGTTVTFTPISVPAAQVKVTAPAGVLLSSNSSSAWDAGVSELYVTSESPVYAFATTTGALDISFSTGDLVVTVPIKVATVPAAAYTVQALIDDTTIAAGSFSTMTARVLDTYGNPVPRTTDDTGGLLAQVRGEVLLSGYQASERVLTDDSGNAKVTLIAGKSSGAASLLFTPINASKTPAWQPGFTPPAGFAAPVPEASLDLVVSSAAPAQPKITITGTRGTVRGKSGITVTGSATGFTSVPTLSPWLRFPGQTAFSKGSAVISPDSGGAFTWSRQTGKKVTVYVATADGGTRSNRVTIE